MQQKYGREKNVALFEILQSCWTAHYSDSETQRWKMEENSFIQEQLNQK